ncbi:YaiI/YqxD family protein [Paenibacillus sp. 481]|uniref:YaiI/YqxD family protein n=1 Tax=Paenibacillus sp. 481 TaxID=2835869 RepID=UPI001E538462|nr:YaiI/YqxD family protein [Paenibacillus sp. 481]UHA74159.1 YaiI/YqxD family protein [Paenibacillus sp. 481]
MLLSSNLRIVVDADACPVKQEIVAIARKLHAEVLFVASYAAFSHDLQGQEQHVSNVYVDQSSQAADMYIANVTRSSDVVVTGDYGLAALCLPKGAAVITARGFELTSGNVEEHLDRRYYSSKARRAGLRTKGPRAMTVSDREHFQQKLTQVLLRKQEKLRT